MQINPEKFQNYRSDYHNLATSDDDNVPIVLATIQYQTEEGDNSTWKEDNRAPSDVIESVVCCWYIQSK